MLTLESRCLTSSERRSLDTQNDALSLKVEQDNKAMLYYLGCGLNHNEEVEVKFVWQISYPPANGASLGSYFCVQKFCNRQTNGQTDRQIL